MSGLIQQLLARKRQIKADAQAFESRRDSIVAAAKGDRGEVGPMPRHEWKGSKLRFEKPDGTWGEFVELRGKSGKDGKDGKTGVVISGGGSRQFDPTTLGEMPGGILPSDFVLIERAGVAYRVPATSLVGGEEVAYSKRTDFISESIFYRGEASPGASEAAAVWRIARVEMAEDGDVTERWAGGTAEFDKVWSDRTTLEYL